MTVLVEETTKPRLVVDEGAGVTIVDATVAQITDAVTLDIKCGVQSDKQRHTFRVSISRTAQVAHLEAIMSVRLAQAGLLGDITPMYFLPQKSKGFPFLLLQRCLCCPRSSDTKERSNTEERIARPPTRPCMFPHTLAEYGIVGGAQHLVLVLEKKEVYASWRHCAVPPPPMPMEMDRTLFRWGCEPTATGTFAPSSTAECSLVLSQTPTQHVAMLAKASNTLRQWVLAAHTPRYAVQPFFHKMPSKDQPRQRSSCVGQVGYHFEITRETCVLSLGRNFAAQLKRPTKLTLWHGDSRKILASAEVGPSVEVEGDFAFVTLPQPVRLEKGQCYRLTQMCEDTDTWYEWPNPRDAVIKAETSTFFEPHRVACCYGEGSAFPRAIDRSNRRAGMLNMRVC